MSPTTEEGEVKWSEGELWALYGIMMSVCFVVKTWNTVCLVGAASPKVERSI